MPIGFNVDELVQQAFPFTFEGFSLEEEITVPAVSGSVPPQSGGIGTIN